MVPLCLCFWWLAIAIPARAQDQLPLGTRVGNSDGDRAPRPSPGYDEGARRDPFAGLIAPRQHPSSSPQAPLGLSSVAMADVSIRGLVRGLASAVAVLEGPGGRSFVAHAGDRLRDAVVQRIDLSGVVFVERVVDALGVPHSREIRKVLRFPSAEEVR